MADHEIFDVIRAGDATRLKALVASDRPVVNVRTEKGFSPVLIAQYHHKADCLAVLLAAGPILDIWDAASVGATTRVGELLDADQKLVNSYSGDGFFPLGLAAFFGHAETVRLLLSRGADVAQVATNPMGISAIHAAVAGRSREAVELIVEAGAPINAKQHKGWTALHEVVNKKDVELARYFLAHGADPKLQNDEGKSAIGLAADQGSADLLKVLKGQG